MSALSVFVIIILAVTVVYMIFSAKNKAISCEEAVYTARSDISVQQKRRVDLVYNLADCVKRYDEHESELLMQIAKTLRDGQETRSPGAAMAAVAYSFPQLKSDETYKQLMTELSMTENMIGRVRENYNATVASYNQYVRRFPTALFLNICGYEKKNFERLAYDAPEDAPQDLFEHRERDGAK